MNKNEFQLKFNELYSALNSDQRKAVDEIDGPVMVIAGAGTGKTQTIAVRIAKILLETDVGPENILCLTFTEAGVEAMTNRLLSIIGPDAYKVTVSTFHSFCNDVISANPEYFLNSRGENSTLTEVMKYKIFEKLISNLSDESVLKPFGNNYLYIDSIISKISGLKREGILPDEVVNNAEKIIEFGQKTKQYFLDIKSKILFEKLEDFVNKINEVDEEFYFVKKCKQLIQNIDTSDKKDVSKVTKIIKDLYKKIFDDKKLLKQIELGSIYKQYQDELTNNHLNDFDDMILNTLQAFRKYPDLLANYQEKYQYILIDEYQDTNSVQNQTVFLLGEYFPNPNIFVVGDDDQSIFKFQGANTQNIFSFKTKYSDYIKKVSLIENHRSHQIILNAAMEVIKNNSTRLVHLDSEIRKDLIAVKPYKEKNIEFNTYMTEDEEIYELVNSIKKIIDANINENNEFKLSDIAVICNKNSEVDQIRRALTKLGIKATRDKGESIFDSIYIKQFLSLLRFLAKPSDYENLFKFLGAKFAGINSIDLIKVNQYLVNTRQDFISILNYDLEKLKGLNLSDSEKFFDLLTNLKKWITDLENKSSIEYFVDLINESGFVKFLTGLENGMEQISKVNRLYKELKSLAAANQDYTIKAFINDIDIYQKYGIEIYDDLINKIEDKVRVVTAHGSKGLEFKYVFIYGCSQESWVQKKGGNNDIKIFNLDPNELSQIEDETDERRRLFYVALTRAKLNVSISYHKRSEGRKSIFQPATFILEIPEKYIDRNDTTEEVSTERYTNANIFDLLNTTKIDVGGEIREYLQKMVDSMEYSISHLNKYDSCPRCFLFENLIKLPKIKNKHQVFGTLVHSVLNRIQINLNNTGEIIDYNDSESYALEKLNREYISKEDLKSITTKFKKYLHQFYDNNINDLVKGSKPEFDTGLYNIVINDIPIKGRIDLVKFVDNGKNRVHVIDFKTGNPTNAREKLSEKDFGDYYRQILFYKLLLENAPGLNIRVESGEIDFFEDDILKSSRKIYSNLDADYEKIKMYLIDTVSKIRALRFDEVGKKCDNELIHNFEFRF